MNRLLPLTTALVLSLGLPQVAAAQNNGHGNSGHDKRDRGSERDPQDRDDRGNDRSERRAERRDDNRNVRVEARREDRQERKGDRDRNERRTERADDRRVVIAGEDGRPVILLAPPPRLDSLWNARNDEFSYRYEDGYLYRRDTRGSLLGYIPVLGGALSRGNPWPAQYDYQPVPTYLTNYYGLNDRSAYRYADGTVYGMDPKTQAITQVVALLTGQNPTVGQPMPAGYDIYNVPSAYRDQYVDTASRQFRYNDGYVYQVDPKTRLVQAVIQLLT